jgi:hypothetical protein
MRGKKALPPAAYCRFFVRVAPPQGALNIFTESLSVGELSG